MLSKSEMRWPSQPRRAYRGLASVPGRGARLFAVAGQLTFRFLARCIEHGINVTVQRLHDADAREHRWAAVRRDQDQGFHRRLPLRRRVLRLRKLGDVGAVVFEGD
jgi:hypothetical protein